MKIRITVLFILTSSLCGFAQNVLHVRVTDNVTLQTLTGAGVEVVPLSRGAITDGEGMVAFAGLPSGTVSVKVSFVGYRDT
ncbi:MAG TPA: carboxypeptidase regulatory-like domain-containing protein, partial [Chryseosolibacter sp.]